MQFLGFFAVLFVLTGLSWLLVGTFVSGLVPGGGLTIAAAWVLSLVPAVVFVRALAARRYPAAAVRVFVFRTFWYSQLLMLALALLGPLAFLVGLPFGAGIAAARGAIIGGAVILVIAAVVGYAGSRRLVVKELTLRPRNLPHALDGLRIAQLSDLHVGPHTRKEHLRRIADATRAASPDIIAYTGDQVDDHPADIDVFAREFGHLRATLGVYAVPGNHDVYAGWSEVRRRIESLGITVLVNQSVRVSYRGADFWVVGTGDPAGNQFGAAGRDAAADIGAAMAAVPQGAFSLVLAHNPALFPALAKRGASLVLSGHTHHGQFSIPSRGWSLASLFLDYAMDLYERAGSLLYVSPGTNYWGIPFRIGALPEVTIVTLAA